MKTLSNLVLLLGIRSPLLAGVGLALILVTAPVVARAQMLLAGWSFNNQTTQTTALTADSGTLAGSAVFTAAAGGSGNTLTLNGDGTISLGAGELLYSAAINSTSYASLTTGVTVYARFTLNTAGPAINSSIFGFTTSTPPVTGSNYPGTIALGYEILSTTSPYSVRAVGTESDTNSTSFGTPSGFNSISSGTGNTAENTAAIVFSASGASITYSDDTNGVSKGRTLSTTNTLAQFTDLAVGRLLAGNSDGAITLNEIDVYQGALTSAQIAAIPEPGVLASCLVGGCVLIFASRSSLRKSRAS